MTYKEEPYANNHAFDVVLPGEGNEIAIFTIANKIPKMCEGSQQITDNGMVVRFAVVGRKPSTGARGQQSAICPSIWVDGVDKNNVAVFDGYGNGRLVC